MVCARRTPTYVALRTQLPRPLLVADALIVMTFLGTFLVSTSKRVKPVHRGEARKTADPGRECSRTQLLYLVYHWRGVPLPDTGRIAKGFG